MEYLATLPQWEQDLLGKAHEVELNGINMIVVLGNERLKQEEKS